MLKSSLLEILRTLTKQELIKFEDFVRSPYFNKKDTVTKLFIEIKKYAPEFSNENLKKEKVWEKIFPGKEYNYGIMKNIIFDLDTLAESFVVDLKFKKDRLKYDEYVLNIFLERGLNRSFKNRYNSISRTMSAYPKGLGSINITDYSDFMTRILNCKVSYHNVFENIKMNYDILFIRESFFISGLIVTLLGAYNDLLVFQYERNIDFRDNLVSIFLEAVSPAMEAIIGSIGKYSELNSAYIRIHHLMYLSLKEKTEQRYYDFKNILFNNINILPDNDKQNLHICLITACVCVEVKSNLLVEKELVEIIESQAANNVLLEPESKKIPIPVFCLYLHNAFLLYDIKKIESFAGQFIPKLDPEYTGSMKTYVNFLTSFLNKHFDEALSYISLMDTTIISMKTGVRQYKAMCMYEINNYEMFLNEFDNIKHFVRNNEHVRDDAKKQIIRFYTFIDRLFIARQAFDDYGFIKLKNDLREETQYKVWLSHKLEEIENANLK